jgi:ribosomal protein S27E
MPSPKFKPRKKLKERCPKCKSSQIYYRSLLWNYKCAACGNIFITPKEDE